ncbi:MAG: PEGA domain-containing protein [Myxococcaceae bacterium]|nr:PEGA domain-containing protein [Myxococcaceae bacterium]
MRTCRLALLCSLLCATAALASPESRPLLVVLDVDARGATPLQAQAATTGAVRGLRALDVFQVLSSDDVRQLLAIERNRQLAGLNVEGVGGLTKALGAQHAVVGSLSEVDGRLRLELRLLDTQAGRVLAQKVLGPVSTYEAMAPKVPDLAQELMGPLLQAQQGTLLVRASEEAAEVLVDDVLVSSTPMVAPHKVARGAHRLVVRKDGFIAQARTVRVEPEQLTVEATTLLPSPDYAEAWRLRHGPQRVGAWVATGVAVAALGGALVLDRMSIEPLYRDSFLPRQLTLQGATADQVAAANLTAPQDALRVECGLNPAGCQQEANSLQGQLRTRQYVSAGLLGVGAIATGASLWFWLTGQDPNRYAQVVAGAQAGPGPGVAVSGKF